MRTLSFLPLALVFVIGCAGAGAPSINGSWKGTGGAIADAGGEATLTFSAPDKVDSVTSINQGGIKMTITAGGTYTLEGDKMTTKFTTAKADLGDLPDAQKKVVESMLTEKALLDQLNSESAASLKWVFDDKIELTGPGGSTMTLDRVK